MCANVSWEVGGDWKRIYPIRDHVLRKGYTPEDTFADLNGSLFTKLVEAHAIPRTLLVSTHEGPDTSSHLASGGSRRRISRMWPEVNTHHNNDLELDRWPRIWPRITKLASEIASRVQHYTVSKVNSRKIIFPLPSAAAILDLCKLAEFPKVATLATEPDFLHRPMRVRNHLKAIHFSQQQGTQPGNLTISCRQIHAWFSQFPVGLLIIIWLYSISHFKKMRSFYCLPPIDLIPRPQASHQLNLAVLSQWDTTH